MFWRFGNYANVSTIDTILDKPDVTVEELLDESDLIQELKQQNSKLIEYLRDDNVLERLLRYVTAPKNTSGSPEIAANSDPTEQERQNAREGFFSRVRGKSRSQSISKDNEGEESKEEKQRMKYAYVACEILSCEVWSISEALLENTEHLRTFWQYLKQPPPLDPIQAGYFTKVNESLLDRKMEEMLEFFKSLDSVVADMLQHVDCPMVMDLLLKIISLEKQEGGQGVVDVSILTVVFSPICLSFSTVVAATKFDTHSFIIYFFRTWFISTDFCWGFPQSHYNDFGKRHYAGPVCDWPE
jgi:SIT4-associating protein SAP185/190